MALKEGLFGDRLAQISRYVDILSTRGVERGLIGPREVDRIWNRHIFNSVAMASLLGEGASAVDVGSGAGLPGIPLALHRVDLHLVLLEPMLRRVTFLQEVVEELDMSDRVAVVRARAEDHVATYDAVLSRAVAPLDRLIGWCAPLRSPSGALLALKGRSAADEVSNAATALSREGLVADVVSVRADVSLEPATVIRVRKA